MASVVYQLGKIGCTSSVASLIALMSCTSQYSPLGFFRGGWGITGRLAWSNKALVIYGRCHKGRLAERVLLSIGPCMSGF